MSRSDHLIGKATPSRFLGRTGVLFAMDPLQFLRLHLVLSAHCRIFLLPEPRHNFRCAREPRTRPCRVSASGRDQGGVEGRVCCSRCRMRPYRFRTVRRARIRAERVALATWLLGSRSRRSAASEAAHPCDGASADARRVGVEVGHARSTLRSTRPCSPRGGSCSQ